MISSLKNFFKNPRLVADLLGHGLALLLRDGLALLLRLEVGDLPRHLRALLPRHILALVRGTCNINIVITKQPTKFSQP